MLFVIIWVACGIGAAAIASSKNKSAGGWLFLGLLLGPLAILIVGFMKAEEAPTDTLETKKRIEKLKVMGDAEALAEMIVDETDLSVCRNAAEALAALGDERGKQYLESPAAKAVEEATPEEIQDLQVLVEKELCPLCETPISPTSKFFIFMGSSCGKCQINHAYARANLKEVAQRKKARAAEMVEA